MLSCLVSLQLLATAQISDKIIFNGEEYKLHTNPLEEYFKKYPEKKPKSPTRSTALWRGYIATFEARDWQLFLKDIEIQVRDESNPPGHKTKQVSVKEDIFPGAKSVKSDWFSGLLVLPFGNMLRYVHMGYASTYENYIIIEVRKGDIVKTKELRGVEYDQFRDKQFKAFKKTDDYKKIYEKLKQDGHDDQFIDSFLKTGIISYTSTIMTDN